MDEIVLQAMAKWPNVPHCYGWLLLDARGQWRMRDAAAQAAGSAGDVIRHPSLQAFINRNYLSDAQGRWYFQNGPQRVYVNLPAAPYILHCTPQGWHDHTGQAWGAAETIWLTPEGNLLVQSAGRLAWCDDRDLPQLFAACRLHGHEVDEADWLALLTAEHPALPVLDMSLLWEGGSGACRLQRLPQADIAAHFGFCRTPQADQC
ncbi:DUF2946 family protein [Massilia sp. W12]|uniref:DUF2946 family protein n=1 Tax=Massilia sp. W12 TaxID=3126507 RepID=UPI0030CDD41E